MGLLAPLYALAALAIAAPVIFHLIRRQPRGQVEFSSLMFLQPSPPRLTRRSRLQNLWLLLIRAAALALIALAFARPFLRSAQLAEALPVGREILLLIDTSGSMQREDVWQAALKSAKQYVGGLGERDRIGLATFDTELRVVVALPEEKALVDQTGEVDRAAVRQELERLKPSYRATHLAEHLIAAAELLQSRLNSAGDAAAPSAREIVLISDLHAGARIDALQGYTWPENVRVDIRRVGPARVGNARATLMRGDEATATDAKEKEGSERSAAPGAGSVRVRIENNANASASGLSLRWLELGQRGDSPVTEATAHTANIQVPPGQARVVAVPPATGEADRLILSGDQAEFDNVVYVPHTAPRQERLGFVGAARSKPEDDLFFFLSRVPLSTPVRNVTVERMQADELLAAATDEHLAGLVVEWPIAPANVSALEAFARAGRPVVVVLSRPVVAANTSAGAPADTPSDTKPSAAALRADSDAALGLLLGSQQPVLMDEAPASEFALLSEIDFRHPLFQPLSDAKFNDFGKVRFWSHRRIKLPEQEPKDGAVRVLARFDDSAPAILQRPVGRGDLWILAAGWQSTASQLALSSKFVPLLYGMLDPAGRALETNSVYEVGEAIDVAPGAVVTVTSLEGAPVDVGASGGPLMLEQPGIYWLSEDGKRRQIAVALPLSESQLDPLGLDRFSQYGVVTGKSDSAQEREAAARLSQVTELENRQKLWRWILVAALGLLILETLLAARREKGAELGLA